MNELETLVNGPLQEMAEKQQTVKTKQREVQAKIESVRVSIQLLLPYLQAPYKDSMEGCIDVLKEIIDVLDGDAY